MALKYGEQGKQIFIIPMTTTKDGLGQYRKSGQSQYIDMFNLKIKIGREGKDGRTYYTSFNALRIDGTEGEQRLNSFNSDFHKIIRSLLEGRLTLHILAADYDEQTMLISDIDGIATVNILTGAITQDNIRYTSVSDYYTFSEFDIIFQDEEYYNEENEDNIIDIMNLFKEYPLYILPEVQEENWDKIWRSLEFLADFF